MTAWQQTIMQQAEQVVPGSGSSEIWQALVQQCPWYGAAVVSQACLNPSAVNLQKAGTFFDSPLLLQYWLSGNGSAIAEPAGRDLRMDEKPATPDNEEATPAISPALEADTSFDSFTQAALETLPPDEAVAPLDQLANLPDQALPAGEEEPALAAGEVMNEAGLEPEAATTADVPKAGPAEEGISALAQDAEEPGKTAEAEPTPSTSQLSGMLAEASRQLHDQQPSPQDKLAFEPYHTVDYFASQGIKVQNDLPETNTRFDKQLMSFTQWLRTMKRVNYQSETKAEDPVVTQKANASLAEEDVITEAMAEVLEKQGRLEKAAEVYAKLMLLHPEKSHYFAARLNKVKELK